MKFSAYQYSFIKKRIGYCRKHSLSLTFSTEGKILFVQAIQTAIESSVKESCRGKQLHLLGIVDITARKIHIGAVVPRDENSIFFDAKPLFKHLDPERCVEQKQYSPRLKSYHASWYKGGPPAHISQLYHVVNKSQMSADDVKKKRAFTLRIQVADRKVSVIVDGKSDCINHITPYLRKKYESGRELTADQGTIVNRETRENDNFLSLCEFYVAEGIEKACAEIIDNQILTESLGKGCSLL